MDPRIRFETKAESNARREREFMALSPSERLPWFFEGFNGRQPVKGQATAQKGNFIIYKLNHRKA